MAEPAPAKVTRHDDTEVVISASTLQPIARHCVCGETWNVDPDGAPEHCPREDPVTALGMALFRLVDLWTSLPPTQRARVSPPFVPILNALQQRWFAELRHALDTPDGCSSACAEAHTYVPPCEAARD